MKRLIVRLLTVVILVLAALWLMQTGVSADAIPPIGPETVENPATYPPLMVLPPLPAYVRSVNGNGIQEAQIISNPVLDMKVLVLHYGTGDVSLPTIKAYLNILGIPYTLFDVAGDDLLQDSVLRDENHGRYYAIIVSTAYITNPWSGPLTSGERAALEAYERDFRVRRLTWYADNPYELDYGLVYPATPTSATFTTTLTAAGQAVFGYLQPEIHLPIEGAYAYLTTPVVDADVTTLLTDNANHALLSVFRPGDGRECMALAVSSYYPAIPPSNLHARTLPYGMLNWVTRGIFLGERHIYYVPQPDDVLSAGDKWNTATHQVAFDAFRLEPADLTAVVTWLHTMRAFTPTLELRIEMPFNGDGSERDRKHGGTGEVISGTLTAKAMELENEFVWLNHTYSHADLYAVSYDFARSEILSNTQTADFLGFTDYTTHTLLTGAYSGITNTEVISAAYDLGVRYLLVNASAAGYNNPTPNTGILHPDQPEILQIPRLANNILYAATTPEELTDMYSYTYGINYTYMQLIDVVTYQSLQELLDFNLDPTMFHMNALNDYGGGKTLLGDFTEALLAKFNALYDDEIPLLSLRTQEIGAKMRERMDYDASGVSGQIACGNLITLTTTSAARIPVTGINYGGDTEIYAGQDISYFALGSSAPQVIPGAPSRKPAQITGLVRQVSGDDAVLTWDPTTLDTDGGALSALVYRVYGSTDPSFTPGSENLLAQVTEPTYTHSGGAGFSYAVTAIGNNCWKLESVPARFNPTAVVLLYFTGASGAEGVRLTWETAAELNTLGFNLYRAEALTALRVQVNAALIPGQAPGGLFGASYAFTDTAITPGVTYFYWLEEVNTAGSATLYGPVSVTHDPAAIHIQYFRAASPGAALMSGVVVLLAALQWARVRRRRTRS